LNEARVHAYDGGQSIEDVNERRRPAGQPIAAMAPAISQNAFAPPKLLLIRPSPTDVIAFGRP